ncbi:MAG: hypothetical protein KKH22_02385 [Proteobacteria bacterium]|nr:hypothetical protein [Pseudomonadota bacterium]
MRISVVFTWDLPLAKRLKTAWGAHYQDVQIGGPAVGDPGGVFVPGRFIKDGVTITSRGCVRSCPWCFVPKREGKIRELEIHPGWIVQDNNLLACSRKHIEQVFEMLRQQKKGAVFSGGLDTRLLKEWHRELIDTIKLHELWFACDTENMIDQLTRTAKIMDGIPNKKRRCYTMIGFDGETLCQAESRLEKVFELGFFPFCQLYQGEERKEYSKPWRDLQRKWARPAIYNSKQVAA